MGARVEPEQSRTDVVHLRNSFEAYGMVLDLLSRNAPFRHYDLDQISAAVRLQLLRGTHIAAMRERAIVGYFGWIRTNKVIAEAWSKNLGPLTPVPFPTSDAVAVTIVAAPDTRVLRHLVRHARSLHPQTTVFFKRQAAGKVRKSVVESMVFDPK